MTDGWVSYVSGVLSGRVTACLYVRQAVQRFVRMQGDRRYVFRRGRVRRVVSFFRLLKHYLGNHAGQPFVLEPWQEFIIAAIYGYTWRGTDRRVVHAAYIEMARKQGKTALAAGLSLYHEIGDGEASAEVYLAANSRDQAKIAFRMCSEFARSLDGREVWLKRFRDTINFAATSSTLRVLAADATKLDGPNPSMFLLDEYHAAKSSELKDVLQSGQGMRENPMQVIITTAGFDKLSACYELRTSCTEILAGVKTDDSTFVGIWTLDAGDDWRDERVWVKSNPNIGVTVQAGWLREQVTRAANVASDEVGVKTKNLNVWCDSEMTWIADHYIIEATRDVALADYAGADGWAGVDLSATSDLTACALMFPRDDGTVHFLLRYYLPEAALEEKRFRVLYGGWQRAGWLTVTPGNVTDYDYILNDIADVMGVCNVQSVGYDPWNATQFVLNAQERGVPMEQYSQTIGNYNRPTKELERLMLAGKVVMGNNGVTRHCFRNVVLARDRNGNVKPSKQFDEKKIDGVIAMLTAMGVWLASPRYGEFY